MRALRPRLVVVALLATALATPGPARACTDVKVLRLDICRDSPTPTPTPRSSTTPKAAAAERALTEAIAGERASRDLSTLSPDAGALAIARRHAHAMASKGKLRHNTWLTTEAGLRALGHPEMLGENVGVGPSAARVHVGFMRSAGHRRNILRAGYRSVAVGVAVARGSVWAVEIFLTPGSGRSATTAGAMFASPSASGRPQAQAPPASSHGAPAEPVGWPAAAIGLAALTLPLASRFAARRLRRSADETQ